MTSELETNIVAVERVKEYSETPTEVSYIYLRPNITVIFKKPSTVERITHTKLNVTIRLRNSLDLNCKWK